MGSKSQHLCFAIAATVLIMSIMVFFGLMIEWLRPKDIVVGYPNGHLYQSKNRSVIDINIYNISDLCNFRNQLVIVNREGHVFFNGKFKFELPIRIEWCANKRNEQLFMGSDDLVFEYPSMRKELWHFPGARAVEWHNDKWETGSQSFRYYNEDELMRLNNGYLEHVKISTNFVLEREYIGLEAKGLAWV